MMTLPRGFIRGTCDRIACGLAIILRSSFQHFEKQEWSFMGDTLDTLANYDASRVFVFDGIASTVECSIPEEWNHETDQAGLDLSMDACETLSRILTRFVLGFYQSDASLTVPAVLCLEKIYRRKSDILISMETNDQTQAFLVESWQNMAVAIYSACRSPDEDISQEGLECFQRNILDSNCDIPSEKWITIFYLITKKQPPLSSEVSRSNTFNLLVKLITRVVPGLSQKEEYRDDLEDLIGLVVGLAQDNLRHGPRGFLYKSTFQTSTFVANHLVSEEWEGDKDFGTWASEAFFQVLEEAHPDDLAPKSTATALEEEDVSEISDSAADSD